MWAEEFVVQLSNLTTHITPAYLHESIDRRDTDTQ